MNAETVFDALAHDVLTRTLWGEARGEGAEGLRAVAHVIMNRVKLARVHGGSWWGNDIIGVCQKPFQFSCWNRNDPNFKRVIAVDAHNPEFRLASSIARRVMDGSDTFDTTHGATHYHRFDLTPRWARGQVATIRIGAHVFYAMPQEV